ncbi:MAG: DUF1992 domain-containing protein, partial [Chloroflexota bacterium]
MKPRTDSNGRPKRFSFDVHSRSVLIGLEYSADGNSVKPNGPSSLKSGYNRAVPNVERLIQEAMARGEFSNLPGEGKPIDLSAYFDTPEELRLAYSVLKSADILPQEV